MAKAAELQAAHDSIAAGMDAIEAAGGDPFALGGVDTRIVLQALHARGEEAT